LKKKKVYENIEIYREKIGIEYTKVFSKCDNKKERIFNFWNLLATNIV